MIAFEHLQSYTVYQYNIFPIYSQMSTRLGKSEVKVPYVKVKPYTMKFILLNKNCFFPINITVSIYHP
jgi:hypothetical protein